VAAGDGRQEEGGEVEGVIGPADLHSRRVASAFQIIEPTRGVFMNPTEAKIIDSLTKNNNRLSRTALTTQTGLSRESLATAVAALIERDEARIERGQGGVVCYLGARTSIEQCILKFLRQPEVHGTAVLNSVIREKCNISHEAFFKSRDTLLTLNLVWRERGQGGKTGYNGQGGHALEALTEATTPQPVLPVDYANERSLYAPLKKSLAEFWFRGTQNFWVEDSSSQGSKKTGGTWTRPDLTALSLDRYPFLPGVFWEVYSFEVKKPGDCNVAGLHEALAHARFVTRPYAIFVTRGSENKEEVYAWTREANRLDVGLIVVHDVDPTEHNYNAWQFLAEPSRHVADPAAIHDKIRQLMEQSCDEIEKKVRDLSKLH